jgi:nucleoside-diphosphate-sugar epimerase
VIVAVTGATGFVGSHVLDQAAAAGVGVRALTRKAQTPRDGVTWVTGTLDDPAALDALCAGADAVLHIAGAVNVPTRAAFAAANIAGTEAIIAAATRARVDRFVHVSSLAAREPALSNYGWSKAGAEVAARAAPMPGVIVRPPGVYGPRDHDMLELFAMAQRGLVLLPPGGRGSWIHARDLAMLLITLATTPDFPAGALFEVDDGTPGGLSHRDLGAAIAAAVGAATGRNSPPTAPPIWRIPIGSATPQSGRRQACGNRKPDFTKGLLKPSAGTRRRDGWVRHCFETGGAARR